MPVANGQAGRNGQHPSAYVPPQDIEAEQATLGAMLIEAAAVSTAAALLTQSDFLRDEHATLWEAIFAITGRGEAIDLITIKAELESHNALSRVGGMEFLTALFDTVPSAANVEHYAKLVKEKATLRNIVEESWRIAGLAQRKEATAADLLATVERGFGRIAEQAGGTSPAARRKPLAERMVDLADVAPPADVPLLLGKYLMKGASHWLTGQTGIGKSTFVYNAVCTLAEGGTLWGMECEQTRILYLDMESGDVGRALKVQRLYLGAERVRGQLLFLREPMRLPDELPELLAYVQAEGISLIIFDTARRCFSVKEENDNAEFYIRVVPVLDALKQIGVATLTLGHPAKNGNGSARGAGAQEDAGDVNLSLSMHRGEVSDTDGVLVLRVTKNRWLGLDVPPLYLKRVGNDQFEAVEMGAAVAGESLSAELTACSLVLRALGDQEDGQLRRAELERLAEEQHVSRATLGRVLPKMVSEGQIRQIVRGVYGLPDPFADENARP